MATIKWLPEALDDLQRLHAFIEPHSPGAARRAVNTLINAADSLAEFPEKGRPSDVAVDFRELSVQFGARGYLIRYRYLDNVVFIVRVWHALENR